jgi:predicted 3-demethylubiquinone-9 3-methyltransferase (glyoxalase superfamily)
MVTLVQKIVPNLWFDTQAEEAANFYVSIFKNAKMDDILRYGEAASEISGKPKGSVLTVTFQIEG